MKTETKLIYGWFSQQCFDSNLVAYKPYFVPCVLYRNKDGHLVKLTCVSDTEKHGTKWSDMVFVDMVQENTAIPYFPNKRLQPALADWVLQANKVMRLLDKGYQIVDDPDQPGRYLYKSADNRSDVSYDTIEEAERALVENCYRLYDF